MFGTGREARLLVELLTSWAVLLQSSLDSFDSVRERGRLIKVLLVKAARYFCCQGRSVLLSTEGALCVSIDCNNSARSWHLELEVCIMRYRIESRKCGSPE